MKAANKLIKQSKGDNANTKGITNSDASSVGKLGSAARVDERENKLEIEV